MFSLSGKTALVTGGSRGIGGATTRLLARCGADVIVHYRSRRDVAEAMVGEVVAMGRRAMALPAQLSDRGAVDAMFAKVQEAWGGLDLFVANAGIWPEDDVAVADMPDARWARTVAENIDGMFYSTRGALRVLRDGGRVVLVSSTAGQRGESMHADYAASKGAMIAFTKSVAIEVAHRGITVNSVAPGWVDTEMCEGAFAGEGRARVAAGIPVGRIATPADIAAPIVFLCADEARHVTGEIVNVNGGSVLCG
ncbi:MAG: SDR family oxidoreductase [Gemmatimonadetes bacterium]|nr:SDR family oxidoreductase [Gemmatimonadota bacterium]MCC6773111.1 SDR family oxidoreductase [Gemmatimonadaceae bacterium]